jgi:hypothetical protein
MYSTLYSQLFNNITSVAESGEGEGGENLKAFFLTNNFVFCQDERRINSLLSH